MMRFGVWICETRLPLKAASRASFDGTVTGGLYDVMTDLWIDMRYSKMYKAE